MRVPAKHMLWRLLRLVHAFACDLGNRLLRRNGHPNIAGLTEIKTNSAEHRSWGSTNFSALSCPQGEQLKADNTQGCTYRKHQQHLDTLIWSEVTRHMLLCAAIFLGALADDGHRMIRIRFCSNGKFCISTRPSLLIESPKSQAPCCCPVLLWRKVGWDFAAYCAVSTGHAVPDFRLLQTTSSFSFSLQYQPRAQASMAMLNIAKHWSKSFQFYQPSWFCHSWSWRFFCSLFSAQRLGRLRSIQFFVVRWRIAVKKCPRFDCYAPASCTLQPCGFGSWPYFVIYLGIRQSACLSFCRQKLWHNQTYWIIIFLCNTF